MKFDRVRSCAIRRHGQRGRRRVRAVASVLLLGAALIPVTADAARGTSQYPDLRTHPPSDLRFDNVVIDGVQTHVLRFANTVWNAGTGPVHLVAKTDRQLKKTQVFQRIYSSSTASGQYEQRHVGDFVFHAGHNHFHFEDFAEYQLWSADDWEEWVAAGRPNGSERALLRGQGTKTTFCIMDTVHVDASISGSPASPAYSTCGRTTQGLSVGWGDTYGAHLPDQWVVLDDTGLADGLYVLRSIADPLNVLYESSSRAESSVESRTANEAITVFRVVQGTIQGP